MGKKVKRMYLNEEDVKKALKIDSFRNLSKDKIMEFLSLIPNMDKDVAMKAIEQFPAFAEFGKMAIEEYVKICEKMLEDNKESHKDAVASYQEILTSLSEQLKKDDLSSEERREFVNSMIDVADKIAALHTRNQKFYLELAGICMFGLSIVVAAVGSGLGINSRVLPRVSD